MTEQKQLPPYTVFIDLLGCFTKLPPEVQKAFILDAVESLPADVRDELIRPGEVKTDPACLNQIKGEDK